MSGISVRIEEEDLKEIEIISKYENTTKSHILRDILDLGIKNKKLEIALNRFQKNEITVWKAARLSGVPLTKFLDLLKDRGLEFHYTKDEIKEEFNGLI